jgi:hypothetical protein
MEKNQRAGVILGTIGGLFNIIGIFTIFMKYYERAQNLEAAEPGCELLLKYIMPALSDVSILAGVLFLISAYGFFIKRNFAFPVMVIAIILALQGSWFVSVPFMAAGEPPIYFTVFWPNLLLYFLMMKLVGKKSWGCTLIGLLSGMGFVFCFMNGIASWSRMLTIGTPLFFFVQRLSWFSSIGWGIFTAGILIRPKEWMRILGLGAGLLQVLVGTPLAIETAIELGRFSLFSIAPITSLVLFLILLSPTRFQKVTGSQEEGAVAREAASPMEPETVLT